MQYIGLLVIAVPLMWALTIFVLSRISWAKLANEFAYLQDFEGKRLGFISPRINKISYRNAMVLFCNEEGIYLKPFLMFRLFHQPILIPYHRFSEIEERKILWAKTKVLHVGDPVFTKIEIHERTFKQIQKARADFENQLI